MPRITIARPITCARLTASPKNSRPAATLVAGKSEAVTEVAGALKASVDGACAAVWAMREREGAALAEDLEHHLGALLSNLEAVKEVTA